MKKYVTLLLLITGMVMQAQGIQGVVVDKETNAPLEFVSVILEGGQLTASTNEKGEFYLNVSDVIGKQLIFSNVHYEELRYKVNDTKPFTVGLEAISFQMEEMVLYDRPIRDVFDEVIKNSEKSFKTNIQLSTFYKENYKSNTLKSFYADGLVDFYIKNKTSKIDVVVNESRIIDTGIVDEEAKSLSTVSMNIEDVIENALKFKFLKKLIKNKDQEFYITMQQSTNGEVLHTLYIEPVENSKEENLIEGKVVFNEEKKLILDLDLQLADQYKINNKVKNVIIAKLKINDLKRKARYAYVNGVYYVTYFEYAYDISATSKMAKLDDRFTGNAQMYAFNFTPVTVFPVKDKIMKKAALYKLGKNYTTEFWKKPNVQHLTDYK